MADPRANLIRVLRSACSGELAAIHAYEGHWRSLKPGEERERVKVIQAEERHHRALVLQLLAQLGAQRSAKRDALFWCIGNAIGILCRIGGWFIPMYGAGKLERSNIVEYEDAARFAEACGHPEMIDCLLTMAEVEWEQVLPGERERALAAPPVAPVGPAAAEGGHPRGTARVSGLRINHLEEPDTGIARALLPVSYLEEEP